MLCQSAEDLIETAKLSKHPEKFADICSQPQNYPDLYTHKTYQYMYPQTFGDQMFFKIGLNLHLKKIPP